MLLCTHYWRHKYRCLYICCLHSHGFLHKNGEALSLDVRPFRILQQRDPEPAVTRCIDTVGYVFSSSRHAIQNSPAPQDISWGFSTCFFNSRKGFTPRSDPLATLSIFFYFFFCIFTSVYVVGKAGLDLAEIRYGRFVLHSELSRAGIPDWLASDYIDMGNNKTLQNSIITKIYGLQPL
jgi:hypothetical protein